MRYSKISLSLTCMLVMGIEILFAQTEVNGEIIELINVEINNLSDINNNAYAVPDNLSITIWETMFDKISQQDFSEIDNLANSIEYEFLKIMDDSDSKLRVYYLLRKQAVGSNYWGTYVFNFNSTCNTKLVIQAPHPIADRNTGNQGIYAFKKTGSYAFFLSGTHRCNSRIASSCSGTTRVCSDNTENYKISDMAHNTDSPFQSATQILADNLADAVFVQLHGFTKKNSDPYIILSNGTKKKSSGIDYAKILKNSLSIVDPLLSFQMGHTNSNWTRLLGTTNTQGRYINKSLEPCATTASLATGRFIHVEQEYSKLRASEGNWIIMTKGLADAFGCSIELLTSLNNYNNNLKILLYPNPFDEFLRFDGVIPTNSKLEIVDMVGRIWIEGTINSAKPINTKLIQSPGVYYAIIRSEVSIIKRVKILKK